MGYIIIDVYELSNSVNDKICFTKGHSPSIDVLLANKPRCFQNTIDFETGLSDFHCLVSNSMKTHIVVQFCEWKYIQHEKEIIHSIEDLLKPINKRLDDLPTKEDFASLSMGLRQEIAHLESKVNHVTIELNDVQQYLRRCDLRILNVPVTANANKEVFDWTLEYFIQKQDVSID